VDFGFFGLGVVAVVVVPDAGVVVVGVV